MWDLIVSVPDHCLSFYFPEISCAENEILVDILNNRILSEIHVSLMT